MADQTETVEQLSPWWRHAVVLVMVFGFTILIWRSVATYSDAPPIPSRIVGPGGEVLFTGNDIRAGQQVFLKYGLMENGSIWGHGAYLGPDFSAEYLHRLSIRTADEIGVQRFGRPYMSLDAIERGLVEARVRESLRTNRYDLQADILRFETSELSSFKEQVVAWTDYFRLPTTSAGLPPKFIDDPEELRQLSLDCMGILGGATRYHPFLHEQLSF